MLAPCLKKFFNELVEVFVRSLTLLTLPTLERRANAFHSLNKLPMFLVSPLGTLRQTWIQFLDLLKQVTTFLAIKLLRYHFKTRCNLHLQMAAYGVGLSDPFLQLIDKTQ
jgi:hypothetical protein